MNRPDVLVISTEVDPGTGSIRPKVGFMAGDGHVIGAHILTEPKQPVEQTEELRDYGIATAMFALVCLTVWLMRRWV